MAHVNDQAVLEKLLRTKGRWAVVGLTTNQWRRPTTRRCSSGTGWAWRSSRWTCGRPRARRDGLRLAADIPAEKQPIDVVDSSVNSEKVGAVVDQAIAVGARREDAAGCH